MRAGQHQEGDTQDNDDQDMDDDAHDVAGESSDAQGLGVLAIPKMVLVEGLKWRLVQCVTRWTQLPC